MYADKIIVSVTGPDHSGKGHVVAAIAHQLEKLGCEVLVQGAETHNASKLAKTDEALADRLKGVGVVLTEMRT